MGSETTIGVPKSDFEHIEGTRGISPIISIFKDEDNFEIPSFPNIKDF